MKNDTQKSAGLSLIIGSILMIVTMVLHPVGGDWDQLMKVISIGIIAHAIAILSVPFVAFGFWGVTKRLQEDAFFSQLAFSFMFFGLVAVMIAAALNGLILTDFVRKYEGASAEVINSLRPIMSYNNSFNHAFDFIYIGAVCISMLFWSIAILRTKALPIWLGYLGILLASIALILLAAGFVFVDVHGFRLFIFGAAAWTILAGVFLTKN